MVVDKESNNWRWLGRWSCTAILPGFSITCCNREHYLWWITVGFDTATNVGESAVADPFENCAFIPSWGDQVNRCLDWAEIIKFFFLFFLCTHFIY